MKILLIVISAISAASSGSIGGDDDMYHYFEYSEPLTRPRMSDRRYWPNKYYRHLWSDHRYPEQNLHERHPWYPNPEKNRYDEPPYPDHIPPRHPGFPGSFNRMDFGPPSPGDATHTSTVMKKSPDLNMNVESCVAACPVVGETRPVCGTNNVTYENTQKLECAKQCGVVVELSSVSSSCPPAARASFSDVISACISTCSVTSEFNPVCGTDDVTYQNPGRFECARNCGRDIEIRRMSSCLVPPGPGNPDLLATTTSERPKFDENADSNGGINNGGSKNNGNGNCNGNNNGGEKRPSVTELIACMQACPVSMEVSPVCGTDGVTYTNPGNLLCTQFCGVDVKVQKFSTCSGEPLPTPPTACPCTSPPTDEVSHKPTSTEECIKRCPISLELDPVCGSDGITYINQGSLQCKIQCGVAVSVQKLSACGEASTNGPTGQTPPVWTNSKPTESTAPSEDKPVCGTNGQTYSSLPQLECAKQCGINVNVKTLTACGSKEDTSTISPDVLASVFPENFVPSSSTPNDSEESYDLNPRYGESETEKVQKFSTCSGEPLPTPPTACPCTSPPTDEVSHKPTSTEECIKRCPISLELDPVCGSDGITYINQGSLQCKIQCGVAVSVQKLSACGEASTNGPTGQPPPVWTNSKPTESTAPSEDKPVCGTNGQTYSSLPQLECAKQCGINVNVKTLTACGSKEDTSTISPDVLASVFPENFVPSSSTPNDSEESYDLNPRYGESETENTRIQENKNIRIYL